MINKSKYTNLQECAKRNAHLYQSVAPFPHIVFEDFFDERLDAVLSEFPDLSTLDNVKKFQNENEIKLAGIGETSFGDNTKDLMHYLNSEPFLNFLQGLTGIEETLIPDPYFVGGGFHEIKPSGYLKIHADFNKHNEMNLDRRINVLVYLNKDWKEEYGGHLELWERDMSRSVVKILPTFNKLAIFSTTSSSYHGHPEALNCPESMSRKSLALYYYTIGRPKSEIESGLGRHSTLFKNRPGVDENSILSKITIKKIVKKILPPIIVDILRSFSRK